MSSVKRKGESRLGRGLDALLSTSPSPAPSVDETSLPTDNEDITLTKLPNSELQMLGVTYLVPGKYQPRRDISDGALEELSLSIKSQGIIQPIVVRNIAKNKYEIIAGERRWRAAKLAQLNEVPCLVKVIPDESAIVIALIENIQREDLNAMEEAIALGRLLNEFKLTHQEVANAVGKSRTTVSNLLRLNNLNGEVKTFLENGDIEMGHARALLALDGELQTTTAQTVATKELSVRETEALIKQILNPVASKIKTEKDNQTIAFEKILADKLGVEVAINHNKKGKGKLVISYTNLAKLEEILEKIK